ncbi:MAG: sigma-70 family RNA polymerase sigma factor [Erysipelotrichia bacterium]|nr:sigma-70 family RNA polymerase sigma factor [Candidatus Riflebacteria bacterium]NCB37154.1 sigma-70 family RNA polymerase sigma factor [Erysipelotrichia bacterium]
MNKQERSDVELVKLVLNGEIEFFAELVERYEKLVFSFLLARQNNMQEVEDVVQETFVKAFRHLASFDCERRFAAWLLTIARNLLVDSKRKLGRSVASSDVVIDGLLSDLPRDDSTHPPEVLIRREHFRKVVKMIQELSEELRVPFLLRIVNELSYQEISDLLNIPLQTVKNRIFKARAQLREKREEYE